MWFLACLGGLGAAPVPLHGPAFDTDGAHYVTVSIVGEQKAMWGCVGLTGRLRNRSLTSRGPGAADDLTAGVSLRRRRRGEDVFRRESEKRPDGRSPPV